MDETGRSPAARHHSLTHHRGSGLLSGEETSYVERAIADALADRRLTPKDLVETARRRKTRTAALTRRVTRLLEAAVA